MSVPTGPPSPGLASFFKGRIPRRGRITIVEQRDGNTWRVAGRYGTSIDAKAALDEAIGSGTDPGTLRVVEPRVPILVSVGGALALAIVAAIVLYFILG
jgi:hypothetical protein